MPTPSNKLTSTRLGTQRRCPRMHYLRYELGLARIRQADPLRIGSAFHLGQQRYNEGLEPTDALAAAVDGYDVKPEWASEHEWQVERETVRALLCGHWWKYENDGLEMLAPEQAWEMPLVNPETGRQSRTYVLAGKIDGIVRLGDGRLAVLEYKTCSEDIGPDSQYWLRLRADPQIGMYYLAARHLGYDVACIVYDVTRKPTISPRQIPLLDEAGLKVVLDGAGARVMTKQGKPRQTGDNELGYVLQVRQETADEFRERLLQDIADRADFYFARREVPRLEADLDELREELWQQAESMTAARRNNRWFRNVGRMTCPHCEFAELCLQGVRVDGETVPSGYQVLGDVNPELSE